MADKVFPQTDDNLDETNLTEAIAYGLLTDYVERGLGFTADFVNDTLDIGGGHAIIEDSNQAYHVYPDQRTGLGLTASATNYVYLEVDTSADDSSAISYHIDTDDSPPTGTNVISLKIGEVDTSADSTTELNREISGDFDDVTVAGRRWDADDDGVLENADVDFTANLDAGDQASAYPFESGDIATDAVGSDEAAQLGSGLTELLVETIANQPGAGTAERYFFATDETIVYRDDGSAWNEFAGLGQSGSPTAKAFRKELAVTNATFVRTTRSASSSSTSSGAWLNAYDGESKDVRDEFNSSAQFSPDESGEYEITASGRIGGSLSVGDQLNMRLQNVTDGTTVAPIKVTDSQVDTATAIQTAWTVNLDSSKTYEIQITNSDSSFQALGGRDAEAVIKRSVVA